MSLTDGECLLPDDVVSFVSCAVDAATDTRIRVHVDICEHCRALLVAAGLEVATASPIAESDRPTRDLPRAG
jgi:hypothetical protein